jgi:phospholipid/cholesterol/gamma-HCH transport system substrate-binding protein
VLVTARIDRKRILRTNEVCRISTASIIGDAVLDFVPSGVEEAAPRQIEDGEFMSGVVAGDPLQVLVDMQGKMSSALDSVDKAGNRIALLAERLDTVLGANEGQIQRVVQKSELALDSFRDAAGHIDEMVGDPQFQKQLKGALQNLPQVLGEARQMLGDARTTLQNFDKMSQRAEHNLANLEKFTEPLGASGPEMVQSVSRSLRSLDEVLAQAVQFSQGLSSSQGSLGKLVTDPTLYNKLDRAADNIEDITRRLRPVLEDVRVFTDKIATDPRQLGVKGALSSRPSGFGLKSSLWQTW